MQQPDKDPDGPYGTWESSPRRLISYRHLGCSSVVLDRDHAEGRMAVRGDMRTPGGVLAAPVAIAMLDTAGINVDPLYQLALTHVEIHLFGATLNNLRTLGRIVREARTQVFTDARFEDVDHPEHPVGYGVADWAVIKPASPGFEYINPGKGLPDWAALPPLTTAFGAHSSIAGGYAIHGLSPEVGEDILHHGPILVTLEAAALDCAALASGTRSLRVETFSVRLVKAGREGPFHSKAELFQRADATIACRAEMRDFGANNALVAAGLVRFRVV